MDDLQEEEEEGEKPGLLSSCPSASFLFLGYWVVGEEELLWEEEVLLKGGESCPPAFAPLINFRRRRLEFGEVKEVVVVVVVVVVAVLEEELRRAEDEEP